MRLREHFILAAAVVPLLLTLDGGTQPAAARDLRPPVSQAPVGERDLALVGRRVEGGDGTVIDLDLPTGASLQAIRELADGWVITGNVFVDGRSELLLLREKVGEVEMLEPPGGQVGAHRGAPVPLVDAAGELVALAWLEGDSQKETEVRAALAVEGARPWGEPVLVAPSISEERVALRGAVLADGSWLLVWVGYDGEDDEIHWSRFDPAGDAGWSESRTVYRDNPAPDIAPQVIATADGALLAWSRYDGEDYRLQLARLTLEDGEPTWRELAVEPGKGTSPAAFVRRSGRLYLFGKSVVPNGWEVRELGEDGSIIREALVPGDYFQPVFRQLEGRDGLAPVRWTVLAFPSYEAPVGATTPQALAPAFGGGLPSGGRQREGLASAPAGIDLEPVWSDEP